MTEFQQPKYFRHSIVQNLESVLQHVRAGMDQRDSLGKVIKPPKVIINGQQINVKSLRLRTFAMKGCTCAGCGLKAAHFALERNAADEQRDKPYHLNLYGTLHDQTEVLFTHDHVLARSLGGADNLSNTQTMCYQCNQVKAIGEQALKESLQPK